MGATGFAVLEETDAGHLNLRRSGEIRTPSQDPFQKRLKRIFDGILGVIDSDLPTAVALEDTFLAKNFKSALKLGQARGAALLAAEFRLLPVFEYTPTAVKMSVVGYGGASKEQVQAMVGRLLHLSKTLASEHEADAAAVAICHAHSARFQEKVRRSEKRGSKKEAPLIR